jgi:hypothetical protein
MTIQLLRLKCHCIVVTLCCTVNAVSLEGNRALAELCPGIEEPDRKQGRGRPSASIADQAFAAVFKVYTGLSGRRFMTDLREAQEKGHIEEAISHSGIARFFDDARTFSILVDMVTRSAWPLATLESIFIPDSTGFSACKFDRWYDAK